MGFERQAIAASVLVSDGAALADDSTPSERTVALTCRLVAVLVIGYLALGRSFAYLGLAGANVFIGELALMALIAAPATRLIFLDAIDSLFSRTRLSLLNSVLLGMLGLAVAEVAHGIHEGFSVFESLQNVPFDYYPLFILVGIWAARANEDLLPRTTFWLAAVNGLYGSAYVVALSHSTLTLPTDSSVGLFTTGSGSGLALVGLAAYHRHSRSAPVLAALNLFVLLGNQQRSEWIALVVGLAVWAVGARQIRLLVQGAAACLLGLLALSLSGLTLGGAQGRGGTISFGGIFGRLIAVVDPSLAARFTTESANFAGTASWRSQWWHDIWVSSKSSLSLAVVGHGYGYPLHALTTYVPADTRTPHNVFFYALGYTGWLGVGLLALLWCAVVSLLWERGRFDGDWYGLAVFCMVAAIGLLGNWFETPFGAIPSYLLVGMAIAPIVPSRRAALAQRPRPARLSALGEPAQAVPRAMATS